MAATKRTRSPQVETYPVTPSSLASAASDVASTTGAENSNLLAAKTLQGDRLTSSTLSPKSTLSKYPSGRSPVALTGAAVMAEAKRRKQQHQMESIRERQTSPNPQVQAMQALMGGEGISRPSDAPNPNKLSEPLRKVAEKITIPTTSQSDQFQTSPVSITSLGSLDTSNAAAMTATTSALPGDANTTQYTDEPAEMGEPASYVNNDDHLGVGGEDANKAFSYPGPPPQEPSKSGPSRGMSLPGYGQESPRSPASAGKRHKCPYCSTDFTRHHNLKSHLLTHSQEKPYVCSTCNARFRRLHDLKRHTKLHTGERPHTCDKCGRRFARGDALARHNKGPGGCAGRRSSQGGEDDFFGEDGEGMDGVEYTGDEDGELDAQDRRVSEPSRKRAHLETAQDPNRNVYRQHSSTYPPPAMQHTRPGDMAPPQVVHPGSPAVSSPAAPSFASNATLGSTYPPPPGQLFQQQGMMTESPKPLSPGQPPDQHRLSVSDPSLNSTLNRNRSPSLTTQFQQAHFGRGSTTRTPPQPASSFSHGQNPNQPQLPPLPSLGGNAAIAQARIGLQSSSYPGPSSLQHQMPSQQHHSSNPGSLSSHGRSSGSSMRDVIAGNDQQSDGTTELWTYVRNLEGRFDAMQREYELRIRSLQDEVFALKQNSQGGGSGGNSYSSDMGGQGGVGGRY